MNFTNRKKKILQNLDTNFLNNRSRFGQNLHNFLGRDIHCRVKQTFETNSKFRVVYKKKSIIIWQPPTDQ